ncbi:DEAD/DEAH box helicase [Streptomyces adustus]|uniref:DEAD/DEAH box helicase n=1 Tax=Streptomyces adustus TaxID=1609272 RepID=UPI00371DA1C6
MTLPVALTGTDVIGQAKTGTGKTLGFGLPLLERVTVPADVEAGRAKPEDLTEAPQALVVVPTRELCTQVTNDLLTAGKVRNVRVLAIYGGRAYEPQVEALKKGVDVVVGTPGRLLDLAGQKKLDLRHVKSLVLDEADEMLDLGFLPDVEKIINMLPPRRQTMLFSATMPGAVIGLARRYMSQPTHIRATAPDDQGATVANIAQHVFRAHSMDKPEMVARILQAEGRGLAMIFCRTKRTAADIAEQLQRRGFASGAVHGDLGQGAREQALRAFRNGKVDVLVCTDVAARGIDVEGVTHVINYQSPEEEKTYLHRIGRTGRAGAKGIAITLVDWDDIPRWQLINKALELDFNDPPETYSTSPHLFEELNIPAGTKGVLPRTERTRAGLDAEVLEDLGEPGGRAPRGRGGRGDRPDRGGDRSESRPADNERPARTPRRRRRTRGGTPLDATQPVATEASTAPAVERTSATEEGTATRTPRRRRRTRGGPGPEATPATATAAESPVAESAAAAVVEDTVLDTPQAAERPRRRRTRRSAEAPAAVETPVTPVETVQVAEPAPAESVEAPVTTPRRRTRKASAAVETAADTAQAAVDTAEATEAKPRRTRKTAAAPAETAVDAVEAPAAAPRRRTRKAAEPETTAPADIPAQTAQEPEPKPRRTRKTAAAAPAAEAETAVDTAEATEAKPRRTRKTAATATAPEATDAADATEAKPRRTRKTAAAKATEAAAEAAVDTAEATEAKPRRTRKTAAAATAPEVTDTADATEARPRRTRKTAAAKATEAAADIPAQTAQEPEPKPRRTRKTAAAAPAAEAEGAEPEAKPRARRTRKVAASADPAES